ncbi:MAG: hypothetical protein ACYC1M_03500 [Armatimonadota bacterium]
MNYKAVLLSAMAASMSICQCVAHAADAPVYKITILNGLGGSTSIAYDINDSGVACGYTTRTGQGGYVAVAWPSTTPIELSTGSLAGDMVAMSINNSGQIAGWGPGISTPHALVWPTYNTVVDWGTLGGSKGFARAINNNGLITGNSSDATGQRNLFYKRPTDSSLTSLGIPLGDVAAYGLDIADDATIVGYSNNAEGSLVTAFIYTGVGFSTLPSNGGTATYANSITSDGNTIVGSGLDALNNQRALIWTSPSAAPNVVEPLSGDTYCSFSAVNSNKWAVGLSAVAPGSERALLYIPGLGSYDLNSLKSADSDDITVRYATAINSLGTIVGVATQQLESGGSKEVAFIATRKLDINGSVTLSDWMGAATDVTVRLLKDGTPITQQTVSANPSGSFTFPLIDAGNYVLSASTPYWLSLSIPVSPSDTIYNMTLANGDADNDGSVNLFDFVVLDSNFNTSDIGADRDGSGSVNLFDYVIIDKYFGAQGS